MTKCDQIFESCFAHFFMLLIFFSYSLIISSTILQQPIRRYKFWGFFRTTIQGKTRAHQVKEYTKLCTKLDMSSGKKNWGFLNIKKVVWRTPQQTVDVLMIYAIGVFAFFYPHYFRSLGLFDEQLIVLTKQKLHNGWIVLEKSSHLK